MHDHVDPDDLEFMNIPDRLSALGIDPESVVPEGPAIKAGGSRLDVIAPPKKLVPGKVTFRVAEVARERGLIHQTGQHKGQVNLIAIHRGTDLAYTTIMSYVNDPGSLTMIYLDTIARLCSFLQCSPGDLIRYTPDHRGSQNLSERYKKGE
jgi:DNA-binding Xre family transcriptional regulator